MDQEKTVILQTEKHNSSRYGGSKKVALLTVTTMCLALVVGYQNCAGFKTKEFGGGFLSSESYNALPELVLAVSDAQGIELVSNPCNPKADEAEIGITSDRVYVDYLPQTVSGYDISEVKLFCALYHDDYYQDCDFFKLEDNSSVTNYREQIESGYYDYVKYGYNNLSDGVHQFFVYAAPNDNSNDMLSQIAQVVFQVCD